MTPVQRTTDLLIDRYKDPALSVESCMKTLGISLLTEWDLLVFVFRHGTSLICTGDIAELMGYERTVVSDALDRLEREKLVERSRPSRGVFLYRIHPAMEAARRHCVGQLVSMSQRPGVRMLIAERLTSCRSEVGRNINRLSSKK